MFKVLVADPISELGLQKLYEHPDIQVDIQTGLPEAEIIAIIDQYDALLVRSQTKVTASIIQAGKKLRVIGRAGVGVDNIDVPAATKAGIIVMNAPDGNTISTAELTFAMIMASARKIPQAHQKLKNGTWDRKSFVGVELRNKVLGIIGFGRIGTEVAKRAQAFGMKVMAYDPFMTPEKAEEVGVQAASVNEIVEAADFITVHTPLTKDTKHMISTPQFAKMKRGVRIINCARGGIIDEAALFEAIQNGIVANAALDVYEQEPPTDSPLVGLEQVVVTPHLGASTEEAQINVAIDVAEELVNVLTEQPFKNAVNLPSLPQEVLKSVQPYLELGEKLGLLLAQRIRGRVQSIKCSYAGDLSKISVSPITRTLLKGILSYHYGEEVNYINAPLFAEEQKIQTSEIKSGKHKVFTNLIHVEVTTDEQVYSVAGTLFNGLGPKIVSLDGFTIDANPTGTMLITEHTDTPGIIGQVGTILGTSDINIGSMQVGRKEEGGLAVMVLGIDKPISVELLHLLRNIRGIHSVSEVNL
ncbi:phosphoglycerate dehydrogenase [Fodinisporobacter ferrooxydans]|uniref:D-3-phosphoglycerate dehydrogenase n=1 Tax=Fodinisporobacter ferrooxydans TaxID=2901836 RepID=A0ABY4CH73_9BACL|nr:phosphoglycerate dehydrogenase [Alicyclobacillaceae bacterium MYW30-H2]